MNNTQKTLTVNLTPQVVKWLRDTVLGTMRFMREELEAETGAPEDSPLPLAQSLIYSGEVLKAIYAAEAFAKKPEVNPDVGAEWRMLGAEERLEKGDEMESPAGEWLAVDIKSVGHKVFIESGRCRRRVTSPGDGWRLLEVGETVQEGDYRKYNPYNAAWTLCDMSVGTKVTYEQRAEGDLFRRRVTPVEKATEDVDPGEGWRLSMPKVNPGKGWRLLAAGETVQDGDYRNSNPYNPAGWALCDISIGTKVTEEQIAHGVRYRRSVTEPTPVAKPAEVTPVEKAAEDVDPGDGWRLLKDGEVVQEGDQLCTFAAQSKYTAWVPARSTVGLTFDKATWLGRYRRRVTEPVHELDPGKGWRLLSGADDILQDGDEVVIDGSRHPTKCLGQVVSKMPYDNYRRRAPKPAEVKQKVELGSVGWWLRRPLEVGEVVQAGDQCSISGDWRPVNDSIGSIVTQADVEAGRFRRIRG